jgi:hypothetical protein
MDALSAWWGALAPLTQWFYSGAVFFSVLFLWQLIAALMGLAGHDADTDVHPDLAGGHDVPGEAVHADAAHSADHHESVAVFKLLSLRSVLAFATLFSWAGALYLDTGVAAGWAMFYSALWGLLAFVLVAVMLNLLPRLAYSGTGDLASALGHDATVHLDIPKGGEGEVRLLVSGVMTHVRAHTQNGEPVRTGASVRVLKISGPNAVEVEPIEAQKS